MLIGDQNTNIVVEEAPGIEIVEIETKQFRIKLKPSNVDNSTHGVVQLSFFNT